MVPERGYLLLSAWKVCPLPRSREASTLSKDTVRVQLPSTKGMIRSTTGASLRL